MRFAGDLDVRKILLFLAALLLAALPAAAQAKVMNHPLKILATFTILADFTKQVAGNQAKVWPMVEANSTPHTHTPTKADLLTIQRCDLVVANGMGLEGWLAPLMLDSRERIAVLNAAVGVEERRGAAGGLDPHAWMDVGNAMIYVKNIRDKLVAIDPLNAPYYKTNAKAYLRKLKKLDHYIRLRVGRLREEQRKFVIDHDNMAYFAAAYGFTVVPVLGLEPYYYASASDYPEVVERMEDEDINMLFYDNVTTSRLVDGMAALSGGQVGGMLYTEALSGKEPANSYIGMMRQNVALLMKTLGRPTAEKD